MEELLQDIGTTFILIFLILAVAWSMSYLLPSILGNPIRWLLKTILMSLCKALLKTCWHFFSLVPTLGTPKEETARFANAAERRKLFGKDGLLIDGKHKLPFEKAFGHIMICAPSRSGKSASIVKPMLAAAPKGASLIITDPDAELFTEFSGALSQTHHILKIDPFSHETMGFNPLQRLQHEGEPDGRAITKFCQILEPNSKTEAIWTNGSREILNILISALIKTGDPAQSHIPNLLRLLRSARCPDTITTWLFEVGDLDLAERWIGIAEASGKTFDGQLSSAIAAIQPLSDPALAPFLCHDGLGDFQELRTTPTVIFFCLSERDRTAADKLAAIFMTQLFDDLMQPGTYEEGLPVIGLLEEFGELSKALHPDTPSLFSTVGRRRIALVYITQTFKSQLRSAFGEDGAKTILTSTATKLILSGLTEEEDLAAVSRLLGNTLIKDKKGNDKKSPLMAPSQIRELPRYVGILISSFSRPVLLKPRPYFKVRAFRALSELPPVEIALPPQHTTPNGETSLTQL